MKTRLLLKLMFKKLGSLIFGGFIMIGLIGIILLVFLSLFYNPDSKKVKYDWCYPSCGDDVVSSFKFSSDGTFNSSTIMFGGMSRWGTWEEIDNNTFRLTTTRGLNSGNDQLPEPQIVKLISKKKLQVGSTIYIGE